MKRNGGRPRDCRLKKIASISNCSNGRDKPVHELYDLRDRNTADNEHRARQDRNDDLSVTITRGKEVTVVGHSFDSILCTCARDVG